MTPKQGRGKRNEGDVTCQRLRFYLFFFALRVAREIFCEVDH